MLITDWTSIGTVSVMNKIRGYPMVSVSSVADSRNGDPSTGNIFFYLAKESLKYKDLLAQNKASLLFSEAHTGQCQHRGTDPMEPTCMRVMLAGQVIPVYLHTILIGKRQNIKYYIPNS